MNSCKSHDTNLCSLDTICSGRILSAVVSVGNRGGVGRSFVATDARFALHVVEHHQVDLHGLARAVAH